MEAVQVDVHMEWLTNLCCNMHYSVLQGVAVCTHVCCIVEAIQDHVYMECLANLCWSMHYSMLQCVAVCTQLC